MATWSSGRRLGPTSTRPINVSGWWRISPRYGTSTWTRSTGGWLWSFVYGKPEGALPCKKKSKIKLDRAHCIHYPSILFKKSITDMGQNIQIIIHGTNNNLYPYKLHKGYYPKIGLFWDDFPIFVFSRETIVISFLFIFVNFAKPHSQ